MAASSLFQRLRSFEQWPLPDTFIHSQSGVNYVVKFSEAGLERNESTENDEVMCSFCKVKLDNWQGEHPLAVHRVRSPKCKFLNTPPSSPATFSFVYNQTSSDTDSHGDTATAMEQCSVNEEEQEAESNADLNVSTSNGTPSFSDIMGELMESSCEDQAGHNADNTSTGVNRKGIRRRLFPDSPLKSKYTIEDYIKHPFEPLVGGYPMLFESLRLTTFADPCSVEAAKWAEAGFVMISSVLAKCIYCGLQLEFSSLIVIDSEHSSRSPLCPFVCHFDMGNISVECENRVRAKVRNKLISEICEGTNSLVITLHHPEYKDSELRTGTFKTWPAMMAAFFPPASLVESGFYYSGHGDCVRCFHCGVGLFNWTPGADINVQHAKASPQCEHLVQVKGKQFMEQAQNEKLVVTVDHEVQPEAADQQSPSRPVSGNSSPTVGSPHLDKAAIRAARACGYTQQQISHAIINFFYISNGEYPNTDLLIGTLKAADENYTQICEMGQEIVQHKEKEEVFKQKEEVFKQKEEVFQQEIQAKDAELHRTKFEQHWRELELKADLEMQLCHQNEVIEHHREENRRNRQIIYHKDEELLQKRQMLNHKEEVINQTLFQMDLLRRQLEDMESHIGSLSAELKEKESSSSGLAMRPTTSRAEPSDHATESKEVALCKICYDAPAQIVYLPCKHLCACDNCASKYQEKCPLCRKPKKGIFKVYQS